MTRQRGSAMAVILVGALIASIAAYSVLLMTTSQSHQAQFTRKRMQTRYLVEAGYVLANQQLLANPNYPGCVTPGTTPPAVIEFIDTNGDGVAAAPDPTVTITVTNCGLGNTHQIDVTANY